MSFVNIPSYKDDSNYRYKMPRIRCKVEGSGNGIKTNFMNIGDVSKALKRPPEYLTKFLGCELCVQARFIAKEQKGIFQGKHSEQELTVMVDKFIETYVLCPKCELPEVDLYVKDKLVYGHCNACGTDCKMNSVHRVAALIIKNPPVITTVVREKKKKKTKTQDPDDVKKENCDNKDKKIRRRVKKDGKNDKVRVRRRKKKGDGQAFNLRGLEGNNIVNRLGELKKKGVDAKEFFNELRSLQIARDFTNAERFYLGLKGCLKSDCVDEDKAEKAPLDIEILKSHIPFLEMAGGENADPDELLSGFIEYMYYEVDDASYSKLPLFLKCLYDERFIDQSDLLNYFEAETGNEVYTRALETAKPLLEWFQAESDSEYESDPSEYEDS